MYNVITKTIDFFVNYLNLKFEIIQSVNIITQIKHPVETKILVFSQLIILQWNPISTRALAHLLSMCKCISQLLLLWSTFMICITGSYNES